MQNRYINYQVRPNPDGQNTHLAHVQERRGINEWPSGIYYSLAAAICSLPSRPFLLSAECAHKRRAVTATVQLFTTHSYSSYPSSFPYIFTPFLTFPPLSLSSSLPPSTRPCTVFHYSFHMYWRQHATNLAKRLLCGRWSII